MARRTQGSNPDHGNGVVDLSGGVTRIHPLDRFMFRDLHRNKLDYVLEALNREMKRVNLQAGQPLTPDTPGPTPLFFSRPNEALAVELQDPDDNQKITDSNVDDNHTVPTASWFSGLQAGLNLRPSFRVVSSKAQDAFMLPPLAELIDRKVVSRAEAMHLVTGASREFSDWLKTSDADEVTAHPNYQPIQVSTLAKTDWSMLLRFCESRQLPARHVITPESLEVDGKTAIAIRTRGHWYDRKAVMHALRSPNIDGVELGRDQFTQLRPFASIASPEGSGASFIYESAALSGATPSAVFVPMTGAEVLTKKMEKDDVVLAARILGDIKTKNERMLRHIAGQRVDLWLDDKPSVIQQLARLFRRV